MTAFLIALVIVVSGFPSFALLDGEGMVVASGYSMAGLPLVSPSAA